MPELSTKNSMFGRERELSELSSALERSLESSAQLVLLVGEPGIGKTRLAEELAGMAAGQGVIVAWGHVSTAVARLPTGRGPRFSNRWTGRLTVALINSAPRSSEPCQNWYRESSQARNRGATKGRKTNSSSAEQYVT
ncbi:MAG: ATP-binding protein [Chloroflexi bacterium]|nr:ATP-binding protein [Chloroflexota bacterium]